MPGEAHSACSVAKCARIGNNHAGLGDAQNKPMCGPMALALGQPLIMPATKLTSARLPSMALGHPVTPAGPAGQGSIHLPLGDA